MNSKDFISVLRKVIREEVQTAVRTELDKFSSVLYESKKPQVSAPKVPRYTESYKPTTAAQKKQYTSNPTLNELLNDTVGFRGEGPKVYMEEQVNYNDFSEWPTMNANVIAATPQVVTDHDGRRIDMQQLAQTEAGAAVVDALTKDYSALMKAIDSKKGK